MCSHIIYTFSRVASRHTQRLALIMALKLGQCAISTILNESDEDDDCSPPSEKTTKFTVFDETTKKTFTVPGKNIPVKDRVLFASTSIRLRGDHQHQVRVIGIGDNATFRESALQTTINNVELLADDDTTDQQNSLVKKKTAAQPRKRGRKKREEATSTLQKCDEIEAEAARLAFCFPVIETTPASSSAPKDADREPEPSAFPEQCICVCTCGAKLQQGESRAPSRNSEPLLTTTSEAEHKKTPPTPLTWLVVDSSGEWVCTRLREIQSADLQESLPGMGVCIEDTHEAILKPPRSLLSKDSPSSRHTRPSSSHTPRPSSSHTLQVRNP